MIMPSPFPPDPKTPILGLAADIREIANNPRRRHSLMRDLPRLYQVFACLDVIEDAEWAIDAHTRLDGCDVGTLYLATYGLLQAFIIQQDAAHFLATCLGHTYDQYTDLRLKKIRGIRVRAAGHPSQTKPKKGRPVEYHSIRRISLSTEEFRIMSATGPKNPTEDVSLVQLKQMQQDAIAEGLRDLLVELQREEAEHREKFRDERLRDLLVGVPAAWAAVQVAIREREREPNTETEVEIETIVSAVTAFVERMERRGLPLYVMEDGGKRLLATLERLNRGSARPADVAFVDRQLSDLEQVATEWDKDYGG